ncbi:MAG TPA: hypothetical protein VMZ28_27845 [Kofleriaceae bacterium]|nr:hypothetical protein [Kofleriaceae bacterium]
MRELVLVLVSVMVLVGCGPPSEIGDAGPMVIDRDAFFQASCDEPSSLQLALVDEAFAAGASDDLHGAGAGAWAAYRAPDAPPGDIAYVEVYEAGVAARDGRVEVTRLEPWVSCDACVFLGRGCPAYALEGDADAPFAPTACEHLFLLHRGAVDVAALDDARLEVAISALDGDDAIQMVEIGRSGNPTAPGGFGQPVESGACIELSAPLDLSASW